MAFRAANDDRVEIFSMNFPTHKYFTTGPVAGFEVTNMVTAMKQLKKYKIKVITGIMGDPKRTQWIHFKGPDGNVYEFVHHRNK